MGDLGPALGSLLEVFGPVLASALRAAARTTFGMVIFCLLCGSGSVLLAEHGSLGRGLLAGALCLVGGVSVTALLAVKNAVLLGLLAGVEKAALGGRSVRLVFAQLGVAEEGSTVQALAARIPLGEAEQRLKAAIDGLLLERSQQRGVRAWLARATMEAVFQRVERFTLARFRSDAAAAGGIDLRLVRDELGRSIDGLIAGQVSAQVLRLTMLIAGAYGVGAVVVGLLVSRLEFSG